MAQGHTLDVSPQPAVEGFWSQHHAEDRDPRQMVCQWKEASEVAPLLLEHRVRGSWWDVLDELGATLIVTRQHEHGIISMYKVKGRRRISHLRLPHPNGMAVATTQGIIHVASIRNPNVVFDFAPCVSILSGGSGSDLLDNGGPNLTRTGTLLPREPVPPRLALIDGQLHANVVGMNARDDRTARRCGVAAGPLVVPA